MSINKGALTPHNRDYRLSQLWKDYAEAAPEAVVRTALEETGLSEADLKMLPGSDRRKVEVATLLQKETTVSQSWIAARLSMGSPGNVSQQLFRRRKTMVARK